MTTSGYWDGGYATWADRVPYGSEETYQATLPWLLETCRSIEDWGAGPAWARNWIPEGVAYTAIDFAEHAIRPGWSDVLTDDLATYESTMPDGILMRHVLEHNDAWAQILANAVASFGKRMALVMFIPFSDVTHMEAPDSPGRDWSFARGDLLRLMDGMLVEEIALTSQTTFGSEHVFRLERRDGAG